MPLSLCKIIIFFGFSLSVSFKRLRLRHGICACRNFFCVFVCMFVHARICSTVCRVCRISMCVCTSEPLLSEQECKTRATSKKTIFIEGESATNRLHNLKIISGIWNTATSS